MIFIGMFIGLVAGIIIMALITSGGNRDCLDCQFDAKQKLDAMAADIKAIEEMYKTERHARRTAAGELSATRRKLAYALHEIETMRGGYAMVGD
jgi:hypothetical protein